MKGLDTTVDFSNALVVCGNISDEVAELTKTFCGKVFYDITSLNQYTATLEKDILVYVCGNNFDYTPINQTHVSCVFVIVSLSSFDFANVCHQCYDSTPVSLGQVPVNVHNVAVFFPKFFDEQDFFKSINDEHVLHDLKLSNKPGVAFRKGIYLTPVEKTDVGLKYRLLRCSTNLNGPTENFKQTDQLIVRKVNEFRQFFLRGSAELNHVLAQTYHNIVTEEGKQKKATIKAHSDKTKDMPKNGVMAFCTFYENYDGFFFTNAEEKEWMKDQFDWVYGKGVSILTRLKFQIKPEAAKQNPDLKSSFFVTLYPNSVLLMSLETNRLYTHAICPSAHNVEHIPVRLGYVIRCSETEAIYTKEGETMILSENGYVPLEEPTAEGVEELTKLYYIENTTIDMVDYKDKFFFSMNKGDYMAPTGV